MHNHPAQKLNSDDFGRVPRIRIRVNLPVNADLSLYHLAGEVCNLIPSPHSLVTLPRRLARSPSLRQIVVDVSVRLQVSSFFNRQFTKQSIDNGQPKSAKAIGCFRHRCWSEEE